MGNFNRDNRRSGGGGGGFNRGFGGGRSFEGEKKFGGGGRNGSRPTMHQATCAKCGKDCQVPFRPTEGKPVFCKDCFEKGGSQNIGGGARKDSGEVMEQIRMLNAKVDKLIKMLTPNVPVEVIKKDEKEKTKIKATPKKISVKKKK